MGEYITPEQNISDLYVNKMYEPMLKVNDSSYNGTHPYTVYDDQIFSSLNPTNSTVYMTASMFRNVTVPFICIFGGIGNTMAAVTFFYRRLRHTSFNLYLAVRSLSDTLFLLTLLAVWFDSIGIRFFHTPGICQIIVFMSYVASFLSVWCVTAITFENYIRICHPTKINRFCTMQKAQRVIFLLVTIATIIYNTSLWTTGIENANGINMCMTNEKFMAIYLVTTYVDTFLTLIIPLSVILILSSCIVYSVIQCYRRRLRLQSAVVRSTSRSFSSTPQAKVTRLLFGVSIIFVILHTPIHIMRLKMIVNIYMLENFNVNPIEPALKMVFENMYYLNFSANFIIFFICGQSFRKVFWGLFCKCCLRNKYKYPRVFINAEQQTDLSLLDRNRRRTLENMRSDVSNSGSSIGKSHNSTTALISM